MGDRRVVDVTARPVAPASRRPWSPDPIGHRLTHHVSGNGLALPAGALPAESAGELVLARPFEIRLRVQGIAP